MVPGLRWLVRVAAAVALRPSLWATALRQVLVLARPGWWRTSPRLPLPDPDLLRFRLVTAYGGAGDGEPRVDDVLAYLHWCRAWPRLAR